MLVHLASVLVLSMAFQSPSTDRSLAEQLARSGRTVEALDLFEQIVAQDPTDVEARLWIARLQLRIGRTEDAEAGFRSVLLEHPSDIDARIGLGSALTRRGAWREALAVLREAEPHAGENSDLFGALARAYRRAGDDRRALDYYRRAKALAPADPDLIDGFEATAQAYGHSIALEGFGESGASDARSTSLAAAVRVVPRLKVEVSARTQRRAGSSDAQGGGGALFRVNRSTNLGVRAVGGPGNTSLPRSDLTAAMREVRRSVRGRGEHPSPVVRRRGRPRGVAADGVGYRTLASRRALHILPVDVRFHGRHVPRSLRIRARNVARLAPRRPESRVRIRH